MARSLKLNNNDYIDTSSIVINSTHIPVSQVITTRYIEAKSSITINKSYYCCIFGGLLQGHGEVICSLYKMPNLLGVKDLLSLSDFNNPYLTITLDDNGNIKFTNNFTLGSNFLFIEFNV